MPLGSPSGYAPVYKPPKKFLNHLYRAQPHICRFFKYGRLVQDDYRRLENWENPLPVKYKMADSGSKCKINNGIRRIELSHYRISHYRSCRFEIERDM